MTASYTLVVRRGCHLCDDAHAILAELADRHGFTLEVRDVDLEPDLAPYSWDVPVLLDAAGEPRARLTASPRALARAVRPARRWLRR